MPLPTSRLRLSLDQLRKLLERERALPTHEETYEDVRRALDRANVRKQPFRYGKPTVPEGKEAIFNFGDIGEYENAYLAPLDQPVALRGMPESAKPSIKRDTIQRALEEARHGARQGRHAWYDLSPINRFINEEIDPANAEYAERLMKLGVPLSQQTSVPAEFLGSSFLNRLTKEGGLDELGDERSLGIARFGGGASPLQKILNARRMLMGEEVPDTQVKLKAYGANRAGNLFPATLDSKILRLLGMDEEAKPASKGSAGVGVKMLAERAGTI